MPLGLTLATALRDPEVRETLPATAAALRGWDGVGLPDEAAFAAIARELAAADRTQSIGALTRRLNFEQPGLRTLLLRTARAEGLAAPFAAALAQVDRRWASPDTWRLIQRAGGPVTDVYVLRALDLMRGPDGVQPVPADQAVFLRLFGRTLAIGLLVTGTCLAVAYPVAWVLAGLRGGWARLGLALVLAPFWTSVLVRTTAWFILLQREGPINAALLGAGVIDAPLTLIFTRFAVVLALVHVLLPFAILPIYAVMRRIDPAYLRAASALGAPGWQRFVRVYWPLSLPGVAAAGVIVFLLSVGFYVMPALVGGAGDQMIGAFIAGYVNENLNWGMAAALAALLLLMTGTTVLLARLLVPGLRLAAP